MLNAMFNVSSGIASGLVQLAPIGGRIIYHAGANFVLPAVYHVGLFVAKGVPWVLVSGTTWAATTSAGRFSVMALAMSGVGYVYTKTPSTKTDDNASIPSKIYSSNEAWGLLGLLASFQIYNPTLIKSLYGSADASLFHVPSKLASLAGSGISTLRGMAETTYVSYITNPLKMYDLGAWAVAKGFIWAAGYTHNKAITNAQAIDNYREIYGFTDGYAGFKNAEAVKNGLLWIEQFNLDKISLFPGLPLMQEGGAVITELFTAFTNLRTNKTMANLRELLTVVFRHPNLLAALGVGGLSAWASGGIGSAITMVTGFTSINKLSGIMWSGPAIVGVFHTPLLYIVNYLPFTQPLLHYMLVLTSESVLAYGSMALSATSIIISSATIARSFIEIYNTNAISKRIQNRDERLNKAFYNALQSIDFGAKDGKPAKLIDSITQDIYKVASEFLKFKEKDRSDYIYAFAIKMLGVTTKIANPEKTNLIKAVMEAVMKSGVTTDKQPEFIRDKAALDNELSAVLAFLQQQQVNYNDQLSQPNIINATTERKDSREKDGNLVLAKEEDDYLIQLDKVSPQGLYSGAVQDLLQKLHHKAELENPSQGRG